MEFIKQSCKNTINQVFIIITATLITVLLSCTFKKPQAPSWNLPLKLPLFDTTYTVQKLCDETENLFVDYNGRLGFRFHSALDTTRVDDQLKMNDVHQDINVDFGDIEINSAGLLSHIFSAEDFWPEYVKEEEQMVTILPQESMTPVKGDNFLERDFFAIEIRNGSAHFTVENQLPVQLYPLRLKLIDNQTSATILYFDFPDGVAPGQVVRLIEPMVGKQIPADISYELLAGTPGSNNQEVLLKKSQFVKLVLELKNLTIDKITARLHPIEISHEDAMDISPGFTIDEAVIASGRILLACRNETELDASIITKFNDIVTPGNQPLEVNLWPGAHSNFNDVLNLAGCTITTLVQNPGQSQKFRISIGGSTQETGDNYVTLKSGDKIAMAITMENVQFQTVKGCWQQQQVKLTETTTSIDIPRGLDDFTFSSARLALTIFSTIDLPIRFQGRVIGQNQAQKMVTMAVDVPTVEPNDTTFITLNDNSVLDLINLPPTSLTTSGIAFIGDGITSGVISRDDYLFAECSVEAPAKLAWNQKDLTMDTTVFFISPQNSNKKYEGENVMDGALTKDLQELMFNFYWRHTLPVAMDIWFYFSTNLKNILSQPDLIVGPFKLSESKFGNYGQVRHPVENSQTILFTNNDLEIFKNKSSDLKTVYLLIQVSLHGTDGPVEFYPTDFLEILVGAELSILIDSEKKDGP